MTDLIPACRPVRGRRRRWQATVVGPHPDAKGRAWYRRVELWRCSHAHRTEELAEACGERHLAKMFP